MVNDNLRGGFKQMSKRSVRRLNYWIRYCYFETCQAEGADLDLKVEQL